MNHFKYFRKKERYLGAFLPVSFLFLSIRGKIYDFVFKPIQDCMLKRRKQ